MTTEVNTDLDLDLNLDLDIALYSDLEKYLYTFKFEVTKIIDADSLRGLISRGFLDYSQRDLRLARIDAWETRGPHRGKGVLARKYVCDLLDSAVSKLIIKTLGKDSFGRIVSEIYVPVMRPNDDFVVSLNLSDLLVAKGHARYQDYKKLIKF